jgi:hypothetical protein
LFVRSLLVKTKTVQPKYEFLSQDSNVDKSILNISCIYDTNNILWTNYNKPVFIADRHPYENILYDGTRL